MNITSAFACIKINRAISSCNLFNLIMAMNKLAMLFSIQWKQTITKIHIKFYRIWTKCFKTFTCILNKVADFFVHIDMNIFSHLKYILKVLTLGYTKTKSKEMMEKHFKSNEIKKNIHQGLGTI